MKENITYTIRCVKCKESGVDALYWGDRLGTDLGEEKNT